MIIKKDIYDTNSRLILAKGTKVTEKVIKRLKTLNLYNPEDIISEDIIDTERLEIKNNKFKETTANSNKQILSIIQNLQKKINIHNSHYLELPSKILGKILFDSRNEPWWVCINALSNYLDWIYTHSINVSLISTMMAVELKYNNEELWKLSLGALLHDIGLLLLPKSLLIKSGQLNDMELGMIKQHCELGVSVLKPFSLPKESMDVIMEHHERLDGSGYPEGLIGDEISLNAKIVMIADVIDEITTERSYRGTLEISDAFMIIKENKGKFSDELIETIEKIIYST